MISKVIKFDRRKYVQYIKYILYMSRLHDVTCYSEDAVVTYLHELELQANAISAAIDIRDRLAIAGSLETYSFEKQTKLLQGEISDDQEQKVWHSRKTIESIDYHSVSRMFADFLQLLGNFGTHQNIQHPLAVLGELTVLAKVRITL